MYIGVTKLTEQLSYNDLRTIRYSGVTAINSLANIPSNPELFYLFQLAPPLNYPEPYVAQCTELIHDPRGWYEVHCYPNIAVNGWGWAWDSGERFANWWIEVVALLKDSFPKAKFGFPKLQPGMSIGSVRYDSTRFMQEASLAVDAADYISEHVEWRGGSIDDLGIHIATWRMSHIAMTYNKPIMVRFFNSNNSVPKTSKGMQYALFYQLLQRNPLVLAAFSHTLSSNDPTNLWLTWRSEKRESAIPAQIAHAFGGTTSPAIQPANL